MNTAILGKLGKIEIEPEADTCRCDIAQVDMRRFLRLLKPSAVSLTSVLLVIFPPSHQLNFCTTSICLLDVFFLCGLYVRAMSEQSRGICNTSTNAIPHHLAPP